MTRRLAPVRGARLARMIVEAVAFVFLLGVLWIGFEVFGMVAR